MIINFILCAFVIFTTLAFMFSKHGWTNLAIKVSCAMMAAWALYLIIDGRMLGNMYNYEQLKYVVSHTDSNIVDLIRTLDHARACIRQSGVVTMGKLMECPNINIGDSWSRMALVDWLVEHKFLKEVTHDTACAGQNRIFK